MGGYHQLMMIGIILALTGTLSAQPTIGAVTIDGIGRTTARVLWTTSGVTPNTHRAQWGISPGVYTSGTVRIDSALTSIRAPLSGLPSGTAIYVCAQSSSDGGSSWSPCGTASFTTTSPGPVVPAHPTAPETWDSSMPNTAACTTRNVAPDCSDFQSHIDAAVANQAIACSLIRIPAGSICTGNYTSPTDPAAKSYTAASVNIATDRITINTHGYADNQAIRLGREGCLPGSSPGVPNAFCQLRGPLVQGRVVYVRNPTANDFQVSLTAGGAIVDLTDQGSGTNYVAQWPPAHANEVIITTSTPDSELPPAHSRLAYPTTWWSGKLATLSLPGGQWIGAGFSFQPGMLAHHIRLRALEITHSDASANLNGSIDPRPTYSLLSYSAGRALGYMTLDQVHIHGLGYPNRLYRPIGDWDGMYMAIQNSDFDQWDSWRPGKTGLTVSFAGQTATIASGTVTMRASQTCSAGSGFSLVRTGGATGATSRFYLSTECAPTLVVPTGTTANCIGSTTDYAGVVRACTVTTSAAPAWQMDPYGGFGSFPIAELPAAAGVWSTAYDPYGYAPSVYNTEGTQGMIGGWGPGPYKLHNTRVSGAGLLLHHDDSSADITPIPAAPANYTITQNTFLTPSNTRTNGAGTNGLRYVQRNGFEWKNGTKILVQGNTWDGFFADVSSTGCTVLFTPVGPGGLIEDVEVSYNTIRNSNCFIGAIGGVIHAGSPRPFERLRVHNNLIVESNGWSAYEPQARATGAPFPFYIGYAMGDIRIEQNTVYNTRGPLAQFMHLIGMPTANTLVQNNILWMSNDSGSYGISTEFDSRFLPFCTGIAKAAMDCAWSINLTPAYTFRANLIVPYYTNSQTETGAVSLATTATNYAGLTSYIVTGITTADRLDSLQFRSPSLVNFQMRASSPYLSGGASPGAYGRTLGANIPALEAAQGKVSTTSVLAITATSATLYFTAPDAAGCPVDVSTDSSFATYTRTANAGGTRRQAVALSGLATRSNYYARIMCAVEQPIVTFQTL